MDETAAESFRLTTTLAGLSGHLIAALAIWETRDDAGAQPTVRRAATEAVDAIDKMLGTLHEARSALIAQARAYDDAADARVDAMLADLRDQPGQ